MSEAEFRDLRRRWLLIVSAAGLATALGFAATFPLIGILRWFLVPAVAGLPQPWREIIPTLPVMLPGLPFVAFLTAVPRLKRRFAPKCPHCGEAIVENIPLHFLFRTNRCVYCGRTVLTSA